MARPRAGPSRNDPFVHGLPGMNALHRARLLPTNAPRNRRPTPIAPPFPGHAANARFPQTPRKTATPPLPRSLPPFPGMPRTPASHKRPVKTAARGRRLDPRARMSLSPSCDLDFFGCSSAKPAREAPLLPEMGFSGAKPSPGMDAVSPVPAKETFVLLAPFLARRSLYLQVICAIITSIDMAGFPGRAG